MNTEGHRKEWTYTDEHGQEGKNAFVDDGLDFGMRGGEGGLGIEREEFRRRGRRRMHARRVRSPDYDGWLGFPGGGSAARRCRMRVWKRVSRAVASGKREFSMMTGPSEEIMRMESSVLRAPRISESGMAWSVK
jgi:hypothetical protein